MSNNAMNRRDVLQAGVGAAVALHMGPSPALGQVMGLLEQTTGSGAAFFVGEGDQAQRLRERTELRDLYRQWRMLDGIYESDDDVRRAWSDTYQELVGKGELQYCEPCEDSDEAREFCAWLKSIVSSESMRCWQEWPALPGLSHRYQWLNAMFEAALYRHADAWWAAERALRAHGYGNYRHPVVSSTYRAQRAAERRYKRVLPQIYRTPAVTRDDRKLRMRSIEVATYMDWVFAYKYRRMGYLKAMRRHRAAAIVPPAKDDQENACTDDSGVGTIHA